MNLKSRKFKNLLPPVLFVTLTLIGFQNCSPGFKGFSPAADMVSNSGQTLNSSLAASSPLKIDPSNPARYICDPTLISKSSIMKLANREYANTIKALLDSFAPSLKSDSQLVNLLNFLESDIKTEDKHYNREQFFLLTTAKVNNYFDVAVRAAILASGDAGGLQNYPNTAQCLAATSLTKACHKSFVAEFSKRAFRKTLKSADLQVLADNLWDSNLGKTELIQLTVAAVMQMPDFIYRIYDSGTALGSGTNALSITGSEYATKIAYLITGSPPDATLAALGESGAILNITTAGAQIDRLFALAASKDMTKRLFRETYGYDMYDSFSYSSDFLAGLDPTGLQSAMTKEMDDYFTDVVSQNGNIRDLMTSQKTTLSTQPLADIYGVPLSSNQITLPLNRAGFLNRAAFLSKRSGASNSPVTRGLNIISGLLCGTVAPPPPTAPTNLPSLAPGEYYTTRDRFEHLTQNRGTSCVACHNRMNNLGFLFEHFDSIGRLRTKERIFDVNSGHEVTALDVNTTGTTSELSGVDQNYLDSSVLISDLPTNSKVVSCLGRKFSQFESRKVATSSDACKINNFLDQVLDSSGQMGSIQKAMKAYMLSADFKIWSY